MWRWIRKWLLILAVAFFGSTLLVTFIYKYLPVYVTPLMVIRTFEQKKAGDKLTWHHRWVPLEKISKELPCAVIASEDNLFLKHNGLDYKAIKQAREENKTRKKPRGASTISQQTAKNVFLWPKSSMFRKGLEVYFTFLIENIWGKRRIMEVYLNSIEMGPGIYGAEAVAVYNFNTTAAKLSRSQCALVAATLPNPLKYSSVKPSAYMLRRQGQILKLMKNIGPVKFEETEKEKEKKKKDKKDN